MENVLVKYLLTNMAKYSDVLLATLAALFVIYHFASNPTEHHVFNVVMVALIWLIYSGGKLFLQLKEGEKEKEKEG